MNTVERLPAVTIAPLTMVREYFQAKDFCDFEKKYLVTLGETASKIWDTKDANIVVNKCKDMLEGIDPESLFPAAKERRSYILWSWYDKATHYTMTCMRDKVLAQQYATRAKELRSNPVTEVRYLLVHDRLDEAESCVAKMQTHEYRTQAKQLISQYEGEELFGGLFSTQKSKKRK